MSADEREMLGELFIVATPIGHLDDITLRAVRVLNSVEMIAAEDTRHTRRLLQHHDIQPRRLVAVHEHNERSALAMVLEALATGDVALVSDAGTPKLSDPGHELVRAVWQAGAVVRPIPGASSLTAALSVTALPAQDALFAGFLPSKAGQRAARLDQLAAPQDGGAPATAEALGGAAEALQAGDAAAAAQALEASGDAASAAAEAAAAGADASDDEVVAIANQVHLVATAFRASFHAKSGFQQSFQTVQGHVGDGRGNDAALRGTCLCR